MTDANTAQGGESKAAAIPRGSLAFWVAVSLPRRRGGRLAPGGGQGVPSSCPSPPRANNKT